MNVSRQTEAVRGSDMVQVRAESPADRNAIRAVNRLAFGGDEEAGLVDRLRADGAVIASLVAVDGGEVVGHILFGELPIEIDGRTLRGAALAPMAVRPDRQRKGTGTALVHAGLDACRRDGVEAVLVLGHKDYYPRFGFSARLARRLEAPFRGDAFMALELVPGALDVIRGIVRYPAAFGLDASASG